MTMFERPSARDIIVAVHEYLDTEVLPVAEGALRYHCRVAGNLLAVVERELDQGAASAARHRERLRALGFGSDEELAGAIREGRADPFAEPLRSAIRAAVEAELSVANPGYAVPPEAGLPDGGPPR